MRCLFVTRNISAQLLPMARSLAANPDNKVYIASGRHAHEPPVPAAHRLLLKKASAPARPKDELAFNALKMKNAWSARQSLHTLCDSGIPPELIFTDTSNGSALYLRKLFPESFIVSYADIEMGNMENDGLKSASSIIQNNQFLWSDLRYYRLTSQLEDFPPLLAHNMKWLPLMVDTGFYAPERGRNDEAAPALLAVLGAGRIEDDLRRIWKLIFAVIQHRRSLQVAVVALNPRSMELFGEWKNNLDNCLAGRISIISCHDRESLRDMYVKASAFYSPSAMDVATVQHLLNAQACGALVLSGAFPPDFIAGGNMLTVPLDSPEETLRIILQSVDNQYGTYNEIREQARLRILELHDENTLLNEHLLEIEKHCHSG